MTKIKKIEKIKKKILALGLAGLLALTTWTACGNGGAQDEPQADSASLPAQASSAPAEPDKSGDEMRAMWISFLEWETSDIATEQSMRATADQMFDACQNMGLNTVIVAVRPFGDALYKSELFPWSHVLNGAQGQDPGYDPLAVLVEEAHTRGLEIEAWINPYRIKGSNNGPETLSEDNPAVENPDWVREINGMWYDPGLPEVRQLIVDGVKEIVKNYAVDGIHFDDYFYPEFSAEQKEEGEDVNFDEETYLQYGTGKELATWRRENVDTLVSQVYAAIKEINAQVTFGISPQGNNENNYMMQYSDVKKWMANPGYVDYVMPQLYWGFAYRTASGKDDYAFPVVSATWASFPRDPSVQLYAGLGAYRVGAGDGGNNDQSEWESGHNLTDMVERLHSMGEYAGFALFRYDSLFKADSEFAAQEVAALTEYLAPKEPEEVSSAS